MDKPIPKQVTTYLLYALAVMPQNFAVLLKDVTKAELDARLHPDRFTLREAIAHVADWEGVWLGRIQKIVTEESPFLPSYDEGQWSIDHDYAHSDLEEQRAKIDHGRAALTTYLRNLEMPDWQRLGQHGELGPISLFELAVAVAGHDGYHTQQIIDYRGLTGTGAK